MGLAFVMNKMTEQDAEPDRGPVGPLRVSSLLGARNGLRSSNQGALDPSFDSGLPLILRS